MAAALTGIFSTSTKEAYAQVDDLIYDIFGLFLDRLHIKTPDPPDIDLPEQLDVSVEDC
jgi:hypothetical protein